MTVYYANQHLPYHQLLLLSADDVSGCIDIASDGLQAHLAQPSTEALVHRILYAIAQGAYATNAVGQGSEQQPTALVCQQVALCVLPLHPIARNC